LLIAHLHFSVSFISPCIVLMRCRDVLLRLGTADALSEASVAWVEPESVC
jgi:hypothetical protein